MTPPARLAAWAELLRLSALFTVPGDAVAGAASIGVRPNRGTALVVGSSLCLYEAGMALNDWADRAEDAVDRPHRPIPSGRITPGAALAASAALTAAGLALAAGAGRRALGTATALAATIWAYDLHLKHTPAAPATMATARALDLLLGASATRAGACPHPVRPAFEGRGLGRSPSRGGAAHVTIGKGRAGERLRRTGPAPARPAAGDSGLRNALTAAAMLGAHTYAVTAVSRRETQGGSTAAPLTALAAAAVLAALLARKRPLPAPTRHKLGATLAATAYFRTAAKPLLHAALNPSPPLTQRAVGGGIRAMIPLQAALAARSGAVGAGAALMGLVPIARKLSRKVSPT
ncbi:UbiA family prenyltransferase [Streptomyces sp. ISL-96]|uniref:SCO3242 family prenyltransferase n=1 Tax=Streptomyces sp. ISL-96 TaxID=2819191 RepID=UPI001BE745B9|nr:UbiA family prenyltransferase [Streptomyces sp. ISL-96]MBT2490876.1 UbiA family prenyltransferase [Streptomyces sp. ISL-96]